MKTIILKKIYRHSIIITLIVSLAFTPVAALEQSADVSQETSAAENIEEEEQKEAEEKLPEVSASGSAINKTQTPVQEYEKMADSWRYSNGKMIADELSSSPKLYASFTPWEWSEEHGGYLSSDGSVIPGAIRKGVDVSAWQPNIDWAKVKEAGIDFAILRCGYGDDIKSQDDSTWLYNVQECEKYEIPYGVYIYSYVESDAEAQSEANHVLRLLEEANAAPDYPVYYDLEDNSVRKHGKNKIIKWAGIFCDAIEAEGYRAGIYANLTWWNNYLNDISLDKYEKWVAQYYKTCQYEGTYRIWQCASDGKVSGIKGNVDINFEFQMDDTDYYMGVWITDDNGRTVFQKADGSIAVSQWIVYKGKKYYVDAYGCKATGFQTIDGKKYYFNDGVMQKKKWITEGGKKYYVSSNGNPVTGYTKIGNYYYGFDADGAMLTGKKVIDGKRYTFMKDGKAYLFKAKIKTKLNYRTGPGIKYKRKGTYKKNKTVTIIRKKGKWGQMTNGYWIKLSYTKKTTTYPQLIAYKAQVTKKTIYRTGPSGKYEKKGTYKKGKTVTIKAAKNGWGQMKNGHWIKLSHTKRI